MKRHWSHKSIKRLLEEHQDAGGDPVEIIRNLSRDVVLQAFTKGWSGPPFDIIALTKLMGMEVMPNDLVVLISKGTLLLRLTLWSTKCRYVVRDIQER